MKICATITESSSVFGPILFAGDFIENIHRAASHGFDGVELHILNPHTCNRKGIRSALETCGITLTTISTGRSYLEEGLSFCDPDPGVRRQAITRVQSITSLFADLQPMIIIGLMKGFLSRATSRAKGIEWIDNALAECAAYASQHGMVILLEAANRFEVDYLHTAKEVCEIIKRINVSNLMLLLDTFHMNIEEQSFVKPLRACPSHLGHMHLSDNNRRYPGAGMIDFKAIIRVLQEIGYGGDVAVECLPEPDPDTAAMGAIETLSTLVR